jgi:hypothetical protein
MAIGIGATLPHRRNPYRGPREFRREDRLPNRQREARELTDRIVADRVVLLHSPSGAGKTSLIEAGVVRELEAEGFCAHLGSGSTSPRQTTVSAIHISTAW